MRNEILLILSLVFIFGCTIPAYRFFGKNGLYCMTVAVTIMANIEVLIMVRAFGLEQTLGNVLFAVTFVITDILSENEGKKAANRAVNLGIVASIFFLIISQSWLLYSPSVSDWASPSMNVLFANTPRIIAASLVVYAVAQKMDVWLYHKWWELTERKTGDRRRFLWLRNNGSTMISQLINSVLYNVLAFAGVYSTGTLVSICLSTYAIYVVCALLDTPVVYLSRRIKEKYGNLQ